MPENTPTPVGASAASQSTPPSPPDDNEISIFDILQVVVDNLRLLILGPLTAGLLALGYSFTITPTYTATTKFMPPQIQQSGAAAILAGLGALGGLAGAAGIKNPADQYIAMLTSRSVQDALIRRFGLLDRFDTKSGDIARSALARSTKIATGKDGFISIDASDKDPAFAAQLANAHVEELGKLLNRLALTEAQQRRLFFEKQLANAKDNLVRAETALKASGVNRGALKANPGSAVESLARLTAGITAQEIKLGSMRGYLTESAPEFKQAQIELAAMRNQMTHAEKEEPKAGTGTGDSDYTAKYRDFKYHETLLELFAKQYEVARIDESREGAVIQVLDAAQPPESKSSPKKAQIAVNTTLTVGFGLLLLIFVRKALRSVGQRPETAQRISRLRVALLRSLGRK
jgi:tyrosine-protein kinase Etk/Wzc